MNAVRNSCRMALTFQVKKNGKILRFSSLNPDDRIFIRYSTTLMERSSLEAFKVSPQHNNNTGQGQ